MRKLSANNPWGSVVCPWWIQMGEEGVHLRTHLIQLGRMARVIHLNNCLSRMHTLSHARWEGEKGGAVKKKKKERQRERGRQKGEIINLAFYRSIGYCFTNLLAQQCCEFNHIAVIKHIPVCWHFLKALLSYSPLVERAGAVWQPSDPKSVLNTWLSYDTLTSTVGKRRKTSFTNMCTTYMLLRRIAYKITSIHILTLTLITGPFMCVC